MFEFNRDFFFIKMSKLGYFTVLLFLIAYELMSMEKIRVSRFSTSNCNSGPTEVQGGQKSYLGVKLRSKLECASTCAAKNCNSYTYSREAAECRQSFYGVYNETEQWYCIPSLSTALLRTGSCAAPYKSFYSTCITHFTSFEYIFSSYAAMQQICHMNGGQLYKIQTVHYSKERWLKEYSLDNQLSVFAIQGRAGGHILKDWYNDDGSMATDLFLSIIVGEALTVTLGVLEEKGTPISSIHGIICEQI